ncbi:MAG: hypothetical protein KAR51_00130 [Candidatus Aenigmarchaeota archaeon]|nr:hypothetical protein [Candidatus Aenigmarchaeota archaeon]
MVYNESHPIRATITIIWKNKKLKEEFDDVLKNHCDIYSEGRKKKEIFKLATNSMEFYTKYDIIGQLKSVTPKASYILKENLEPLRTSIDMFNDKDNIKESVKFVQKLLIKVIRDKHFFYNFCKWTIYDRLTVVYSLNGISFRNPSFYKMCVENLPVLLGWFILPLSKIVNIYFKTDNDLNKITQNSIGIVKSIENELISINKVEIIVSMLVIIFIYSLVIYIKWRQKRNVIRI